MQTMQAAENIFLNAAYNREETHSSLLLALRTYFIVCTFNQQANVTARSLVKLLQAATVLDSHPAWTDYCKGSGT